MSFLTLIPDEDNFMKNLRLAAVGTLVVLLLTSALAQKAAQHLLSSDELKNLVPAEFFFRGQKAPAQLRNATGFQTANGKVTLGALVDVSGYSTTIQQKYQGMLVTESKLEHRRVRVGAGRIRLRIYGGQVRGHERGQRRRSERASSEGRGTQESRSSEAG